MSASITISQAEQYFNTRLHAEAWNSASAGDQQKALIQAGRDISRIPYLNPPLEILTAAICEQAIFLLSLTPADMERYRVKSLGVTYRWVGDARENYGGAGALISPEAVALLSDYTTRHRRMGGIR